MTSTSKSSEILCGPVVGLVTHDSARILLEVSEDTEVTMEARSVDGGDPCVHSQHLPARRPSVFVFYGLHPGTQYDVTIQNVRHRNGCDVPCKFQTLQTELEAINVAVVSCDFPERKRSKDMWKVLYKRCCESTCKETNRIQLLLHIGDNVYMDGDASGKMSNKELIEEEGEEYRNIPYFQAKHEIKDLPREEWETKRERILEIYRDRYRFTWGRKYKARVLASCSNLMILDDHEIRDDFGDLEEDGDPESKEYWLGSLALQVYHEYQRQLWDPDILTRKQDLYNEFYTIKLGPLGIAMIDARTPNSFYKHRRDAGDESFYGNQQTEALVRLLSPEDEPDTRMWLLCFGLPLVFLKRKITKLLTTFSSTDDDLKVFNERHENDLDPIWDAICSWKSRMEASGDVIVLAGDVHLGGFTEIEKKLSDGESQFVCHQITTSPICNIHFGAAKYLCLACMLNDKEDMGDYTYRHVDWVDTCNFLNLRVNFRQRRQVQYEARLVLEKGQTIKKTSCQATDWSEPSDCCCLQPVLQAACGRVCCPLHRVLQAACGRVCCPIPRLFFCYSSVPNNQMD